jgi:hypothetical protein
MDYGYFNTLIDREVDRQFWGTRTQHIVGVAACLAFADHASQSLFSNYLKQPLCFAKSPAAFVAHTFFFIFTGVTAYVALDAAFNPDIDDGKRMAAFKEGTYCTYVGTNTVSEVMITCYFCNNWNCLLCCLRLLIFVCPR